MIDIKSQPKIIADIMMLTVSDGGRKRGIEIEANSRYMPHLVIDDRTNRVARIDSNNQSTEHYMGVQFEPALSIADPKTGSGRYPLRLMYYPRVDYTSLRTGPRSRCVREDVLWGTASWYYQETKPICHCQNRDGKPIVE